jgi:hypothetical protein
MVGRSRRASEAPYGYANRIQNLTLTSRLEIKATTQFLLGNWNACFFGLQKQDSIKEYSCGCQY